MKKRCWTKKRNEKNARIAAVQSLVDGKIIRQDKLVDALEVLLKPNDRIVLEGNNQKQASTLSAALNGVNPDAVNNLHIIIPCIGRPEHLDIFEKGIARKVDFCYSGPQSVRLSQMIEDGLVDLGAIHTYAELYARTCIDLTPNIALICAEKTDLQGNLYMGPSSEDTVGLIEASVHKDGIIIVQANEIVDDESQLERVDIPSGWVNFVVQAREPFPLAPLFTRDPKLLKDTHILMAMMAIKGIYAKHHVKSLNHGVGFATAAIELILPTYGEQLGLKGQICKHWLLNPHPTMIPLIESGWVESIFSPGSELGMEKYVEAHPDVFFNGADGAMHSNRLLAHLSGQYANDLFIGASLQIDGQGNSSTVTHGRLAGFGGAPNLGHNPGGRRHSSESWLSTISDDQCEIARGRKLVVQIVETFQSGEDSTFVEKLDAVDVAKQANLPVAPVMIYGEDVSHLLTEEGIAYLYMADSVEERELMIAAVAGVTKIGEKVTDAQMDELRKAGKVVFPEDLGIQHTTANRSWLAAKSIDELVRWSDGLYEPPAQFSFK